MAVQYEVLLDTVCRSTDLGAGPARAAAEAALTTLARRLGRTDRRRLLDELPTELRDDFPVDGEPMDWDEAAFVREASLLARRPPEEARLRTRAVLAALAELEPDLVASFVLPTDIRDMFAPLRAGDGIVGPQGGQPPLTPEELAEAMRRLPYWSGDLNALVRTIELPDANLDRVLDRIELLRRNLGRGPRVRRHRGSADLVVCTSSVDAVTELDIELAHRIDAAIDEAGAGMASS